MGAAMDHAYLTEYPIAIFKISERCNLKCDYCYFFFGGDDSWKTHAPIVSDRVVDQVGAFCAQYAKARGLKTFRVVFHGGEPLLMRREKFSAMCRALRRHEDGFRFQFGLQTNAALVDAGWIDLFAEQRISVGVSLDGDQEQNDRHRVDKRGRGSYLKAVAGLKQLQDAANQGRIPPTGILCVMNAEADGEQTVRHFVDELGVKSLNILWPDYSHDTKPSEQDLARIEAFALSALRWWLRTGGRGLYIRIFTEYLTALASREVAATFSLAHNDYRNLFAVSSNGDIGPEDTLHGLSPEIAKTGLNVATSSLQDVFATGIWRMQGQALEKKPAQCEDCVWWNVCRGGKPVNRYSSANGFDNPSIYCRGLKEIFSELAAFLVKAGKPIGEIQEVLSR